MRPILITLFFFASAVVSARSTIHFSRHQNGEACFYMATGNDGGLLISKSFNAHGKKSTPFLNTYNKHNRITNGLIIPADNDRVSVQSAGQASMSLRSATLTVFQCSALIFLIIHFLF